MKAFEKKMLTKTKQLTLQQTQQTDQIQQVIAVILAQGSELQVVDTVGLSLLSKSKVKASRMLSKGVQLQGIIYLNFVCCGCSILFFSNVSQCPSQRFHRCLEKKLLPPFICRLIDSQHQNNPICFNLCKTMSASLHAVLVQCTHTSLCKVPTSVQSKQKYTHCKQIVIYLTNNSVLPLYTADIASGDALKDPRQHKASALRALN